MNASEARRRGGRWWWVALTVDVIVGALGAAVAVVVFATEGTATPSGGTQVTGTPAMLIALGLLVAGVAATAFVPLLIAAVWFSTRRHESGPARPVFQLPTSPTNPIPTSFSASSASSGLSSPVPAGRGQTGEERRVRALRGQNMRGLGSRRSNRQGWILTVIVFGFMAAVFAFVVLASTPVGALIAGVGITVFFGVVAGLVGWGLVRAFTPPKNDKGTYGAVFARQDQATLAWGGAVFAARQYSEDVRLVGSVGDRYRRMEAQLMDVAEDLARATGHAPVEQVRPNSVWAHAMWNRYAYPLLGREVSVWRVAQRLQVPFTAYVEVAGGTPEPAPTVLIDANGTSVFFQQRNELIFDDPQYPVRVVDLVFLSDAKRQIQGRTVEFMPIMQTFTYVETWFPADHWLHVYPGTRTSLNRFGVMGVKVDGSARPFNRRFNTQTDSPTWARLVLNPAVMKTLLDAYPVRFTVDAGRLVLHTHNGWLPAEQIAGMVDTVRRVARSADAAETR